VGVLADFWLWGRTVEGTNGLVLGVGKGDTEREEGVSGRFRVKIKKKVNTKEEGTCRGGGLLVPPLFVGT